ncbi:hypothetical protein CMV_009440 [Castanea mollissima]|uniref:WRKY domain-containing protein n=1 Tax=Castanea mollissima TaxID=60419 RepID=A0A8J4VMY8_9ROSI|nr:hypothetical protein CMV_009440 [Castanea mollissima]
MTSRATRGTSLRPPMAVEDHDDEFFSGGGGEEEFRLQQNWPTGLAISPLSFYEAGLISPGFFDSPGQAADDGYNWRKYGLKQVKGSEFARSYYKCTFSGCPVKKRVEHSLDGQVKIIYKGQHNHELPQKRAKDTGNSNQGNPDFASQVQSGNLNKLKEETCLYLMSKKDQESSQATSEHLSGTTNSEVVDVAETGVDEKDEDEPESERQSTEVRVLEPASSHRTVTEPRIVQTTSEVDLLDDGYRWRKYGQKIVRGNPYPRRYYKCTTLGCSARKHVERASSDPKVVISTYEGKHNHDIPAAKSSSHNTANSIASQSKPDKILPEKHSLINNMGLGNKWETYSINLGILDKNSEKQTTSEPHGMVINVEPVKMTISSEQKKIEIGEIGNLASQERQPERIQVEEMQPQALSTQGVVFDDGAVKILKSNGQMESQIEDVEMEPEASEQCGLFLMQGGLGLTKPPKDDDWKNAKEIYLMDNELSILPENPRCPNLSALFLPRNYKLRMIPPSFFDYMPALQILNLSRTGIKSLPDSLIRLVSLKRLFLNDCHRLMTLSPKVGNLKLLEVLDLEGAKIMDLPMEIKELTNLKCLEVSFYGYTSNGRRAMQSNAVVPCGVISALSQLEELNIDVNPDDARWDACVEDIVTEVCTLTRFTVGRHVKRIMSRVPRDVEFELERWERCLRYINGVGVPRDIKNVLQHVTAFFLDRHVTVKKLSDFGTRNMKQLKCCVVGECNEVQVIIDAQDAYGEDGISEIVSESYDAEKIVLGSLEYLYVYYMKSLRSI